MLRRVPASDRDSLLERGRRLARRYVSGRPVRIAYALLNDFQLGPWVKPATWFAILRGDLADPSDPSLLPLLETAVASRPTPYLRKRIAVMSARSGELTRARGHWTAYAKHDPRLAELNIRELDGLLTETDPAWLPMIPGPAEPLEPVSRTRILHILKSSVPDRWSGYTIRNVHNLVAQRDVGLEPIVVTDINWPREYGTTEIEPVIEVEGIVHHRLDRGPDYRRVALPNDVHLQNLTDELVPLVRELRPAILHAHSAHRGGQYAMAALALREKFGIPVVYEVRGLFEGGRFVREGAEQWRRRMASEDRILREVDGVLPISNALADELVERGIPRSRITVIPNGIDMTALDRTKPNPGLRAQLGLADRRTVGYIGNLDMRIEGLEVLLSAVAVLRKRGRRDIAALIVGDGLRRGPLQRHAMWSGLGAAAKLTGRVPHAEIANYYRCIDLFVVARLDDRTTRLITPIKPFEALALGVPVLTSDLPALREIVDPPNRGAVAPSNDPLALADEIERLLDAPAERARMAAAGRAWVRRERTWASNGPRYKAAYERILGPLG